jgi:hypothetical protein
VGAATVGAEAARLHLKPGAAFQRCQTSPFAPHYQPALLLKGLLRKAGERTLGATWHRIGDLLGHFTPAECANYLTNAGYASI